MTLHIKEELFDHGVVCSHRRQPTVSQITTILDKCIRDSPDGVYIEPSKVREQLEHTLAWQSLQAQLFTTFLHEFSGDTEKGKLSLVEVAQYLLVHAYRPKSEKQAQHMVAAWPGRSPSSTPPSSPGVQTATSGSHIAPASPRSAGVHAYASQSEQRAQFMRLHLPTLLESIAARHQGKVSLAMVDRLQFSIGARDRTGKPISTRVGILGQDVGTSPEINTLVEILSSLISTEEPFNHEVNYFANELNPEPMTCTVVQEVSKGTVVMHDQRAEQWARQSSQSILPFLSDVRLERCFDSYIYILRPVRNVLIRACNRCTVIIGAAAGVVTMDVCESVELRAACGRARIVNTVESQCYLQTQKQAVIMGDSRDIAFAPYGVSYAFLALHLHAAGLVELASPRTLPAEYWAKLTTRDLAPMKNMWNAPVFADVITADTSENLQTEDADRGKSEQLSQNTDTRIAHFISPEAFTMAFVPSGVNNAPRIMQDRTLSATQLLPLPEIYVSELKRRAAVVQDTRNKLQRAAASLPEESRTELQTGVQAHFREWLVQTGRAREVTDLVKLHRAEHANAGSPLKRHL